MTLIFKKLFFIALFCFFLCASFDGPAYSQTETDIQENIEDDDFEDPFADDPEEFRVQKGEISDPLKPLNKGMFFSMTKSINMF